MSLQGDSRKLNIPILGKANYSQWAFRCREHLESRNVWYLIDDSEATSSQKTRLALLATFKTTPLEKLPADQLLAYHAARDKVLEDSAIARAFIGEYLDSTNGQHIQDIRDPQERWFHLAKIHQGTESGSKLMHLQALLTTDGFVSVEAQLSHIQETARSLSAICQPTEESKTAPHILVSELAAVSLLWNLGSDFDVFVTSVMNTLGKVPLHLDDIVPKLLQEHLRINSAKGFESAKSAKLQQTSRPHCDHCRKPGHSTERCFKLHPELAPATWKHSAKVVTNTDQSPIYPLALTLSEGAYSCRQPAQSSPSMFLLDSGCTTHMSNSTKTMRNIKHCKAMVSTANGEMVASHIGDLHVGSLVLRDTLYCPSLTENLISVSKLADEGLKVEFDSHGWQATDHNGIAKIAGDRQRNLYILTDHQAIKDMAAVATTDQDMAHALSWHERLGHLSITSMHSLSALGINPSIKQIFCRHCEIGKLSRAPFPKGTASRASRIGELIHTDVCGPLQASNSGYRYFVTFIDDYSRMTFTYLMRDKSQVLTNLKHFVPRVENVTGRTIGRLR